MPTMDAVTGELDGQCSSWQLSSCAVRVELASKFNVCSLGCSAMKYETSASSSHALTQYVVPGPSQ